jgi:hypothetical protein
VSSHTLQVNIFLWEFLVCPWNTALQMTKNNIIYYNFTRLLDQKKIYWEHDFKNIHVFRVSKATQKVTICSLDFITKKRGATSIWKKIWFFILLFKIVVWRKISPVISLILPRYSSFLASCFDKKQVISAF